MRYNDLHDAFVHVTSGYSNSKSIYEYFKKVEFRRSNSSNGTQQAHISQNNSDISNDIKCCRFLINIVRNFPNNTIKNVQTALFTLNRKNIEDLFLHCCMSTNINIDSPATPFLSPAVKDMCMDKINSITRIKNDEGKKQHLVIKFVNKYLDLIKLKEIVNSETFVNAFPVNRNINEFREPCISLQYSNNIRADVVTYKQAIGDEKYHPSTCSKYENRYIHWKRHWISRNDCCYHRA